MPKSLKRVVYDGNAEEYVREFSNGKKIVLKKGMVTTVPEDIHKVLMDGRKKAHIVNVVGIEDNYRRKLKDRLIREG